MSYEVGDIIWVVGTQRVGLKVYQIVEQVTRKTLLGTETFFMIKHPSEKSNPKTFPLENVKGKIFTSSSDVKVYMMQTAEEAIDNMIESSLELVGQTNQSIQIIQNEPSSNVSQKSPEAEKSTIILEDGTKAKVNIDPGILENF